MLYYLWRWTSFNKESTEMKAQVEKLKRDDT